MKPMLRVVSPPRAWASVLLGCSMALSACTPTPPASSPPVSSSNASPSAPTSPAAADPLVASMAASMPLPTSSQAALANHEPVAIVDGQAVAADPDVASVARPDMPYADFRQAVTDLGWYPWPSEECRANVVGDNHATVCAQHPDMASCRACDVLPELSSCSGDGHCLMRFQMDGGTQVLRVTTFGLIKDASVNGDGSRLRLTRWEKISD